MHDFPDLRSDLVSIWAWKYGVFSDRILCPVHILRFCNAFTVRTSRINLLAHLQKNKCFLIIMPAVAIIQLIIIYFGGDIFRTTPLHIRELVVCAGFAMSILPLDAIRKRIWR